MTDDTQAAQEAWQELIERDDRTSPEEYPEMALITFEELAEFMASASRSIPAAAAPVRERVTPENMRRLKAAYDAKRKVPIQLTTGDALDPIPAAAALLRDAGWRVEEPKCGTCRGEGKMGRYGDHICPTCKGTGKRKVGE